MSTYTDGFVIPVPKKNLDSYRSMATIAAEVWREHGAIDYKECVLEDDNAPMCLSFRKGLNLKDDETVIFAWITYASRAERDRINAAVMEDPRIKDSCSSEDIPFDPARMFYSGFSILVDGQKPAAR